MPKLLISAIVLLTFCRLSVTAAEPVQCSSSGGLTYVCGATMAIQTGAEVWIGSFSGDRIGIVTATQ